MLKLIHLLKPTLFFVIFTNIFPALLMASETKSINKSAQEISTWLNNFTTKTLPEEPAAGVSILVAKGDDILIKKAYGFADLENQTVSKAETVYQIGSLTKQFTAVAILQLEEQGKLSLADDITKYLPNYPTHSKKMTIANLLYHTSGIKNYIKVGYTDSRIAPGRLVNNSEYRLDLRPEEMTSFFENEALEFIPGSSWSYSNAGYFLAGLIIEKVSGLSYKKYIESKLMAPISMSNSSYTDFEKIIANRARGYKVSEGKLLNANAMSMSVPFSAGALSSTVVDLLKWNRKLHTSNEIINKASYLKLITPGKLDDSSDLPMNYALGIASIQRDGHKVIMHPGAINGFSSVSAYYPDHDLTVIVLSNTYNKQAITYADKVELMLSAYLLDADLEKFDYR